MTTYELRISDWSSDVCSSDLSDADRVLAAADAFERHRHRLDRRQDADVQALGVMVLQVILDLARHVGVVRALRVEPEYRRHAGHARACDCELHPDPIPERRKGILEGKYVLGCLRGGCGARHK